MLVLLRKSSFLTSSNSTSLIVHVVCWAVHQGGSWETLLSSGTSTALASSQHELHLLAQRFQRRKKEMKRNRGWEVLTFLCLTPAWLKASTCSRILLLSQPPHLCFCGHRHSQNDFK